MGRTTFRTTFPAMGTIVSFVSEEPISADALDAVRDRFHELDRRFSRFDAESELSAVVAGRLRLADASESLRAAYAASIDWRRETEGLFTPHRPDGTLDLNGIVKAIALREAGAVLDAAGVCDWSLDCGGDVLFRRDGGRTATAGIADPVRQGALLAAITIDAPRRAVATSGSAERGNHIWGRTGEISQATVVADDIVLADVLATTLIAGGLGALADLPARHDIDVLVVLADGTIRATPGIRLAAG